MCLALAESATRALNLVQLSAPFEHSQESSFSQRWVSALRRSKMPWRHLAVGGLRHPLKPCYNSSPTFETMVRLSVPCAQNALTKGIRGGGGHTHWRLRARPRYFPPGPLWRGRWSR